MLSPSWAKPSVSLADHRPRYPLRRGPGIQDHRSSCQGLAHRHTGRWTRTAPGGYTAGNICLAPLSTGAAMSEVTRILSAIDQGDPTAASQLLPLVYEELRKLAAARLAQEGPGQTLQPTALVHEAYPRLVDVDQAQPFNSRGHFFAAAAEAMRRILIDNARRKGRQKRGGGRAREDLDQASLVAPEGSLDLLALDEALNRLAAVNPRAATLVQL